MSDESTRMQAAEEVGQLQAQIQLLEAQLANAQAVSSGKPTATQLTSFLNDVARRVRSQPAPQQADTQGPAPTSGQQPPQPPPAAQPAAEAPAPALQPPQKKDDEEKKSAKKGLRKLIESASAAGTRSTDGMIAHTILTLAAGRYQLINSACEGPAEAWKLVAAEWGLNNTDLLAAIQNSTDAAPWSGPARNVPTDMTAALKHVLDSGTFYDSLFWRATQTRPDDDTITPELLALIHTHSNYSKETLVDRMRAVKDLVQLQAQLSNNNEAWLTAGRQQVARVAQSADDNLNAPWLLQLGDVTSLKTVKELTVLMDQMIKTFQIMNQNNTKRVTLAATPVATPAASAAATTQAPRPPRTCWTCGQTGHIKAACPQNTTVDQQMQQLEKQLAELKRKASTTPTKPKGESKQYTAAPGLVVRARVTQNDGAWNGDTTMRIDTGAEASVISQREAARLNLVIENLEAPVQLGSAAKDTPPWTAVGAANDVYIDVGGTRIMTDLLVVKEELSEALLGLPALCEAGGSKDTHTIAWRRKGDRWQARLGRGAWIDAGRATQDVAGHAGIFSVRAAMLETAPEVMAKLQALIDRIDEARQNRQPGKPLAPPSLEDDEPAITYEDDEPFRTRHDQDMAARNVIEKARVNIQGTEDEINETMAILREFASSFSDAAFAGGVPPICNVGEHFVRLPTRHHDVEKSDLTRLRRHRPGDELEFLERQRELLIETGRATAAYVAHGPIVDSMGNTKIKADGSIKWRLVHNMRVLERLHAVTQTQIPHLHEMAEDVTQYAIFSELDAVSYYWQFPLGKRSAKYVMIRVGSGLVEMKVTPQGASAAANHIAGFTAAQLMHKGDGWAVFAYFDNFIVAGKTRALHNDALRWLLRRTSRQELSITLNVLKCKFGHTQLTSLGKKFREMQLEPTEEWKTAVLALPQPTTRRELLGPMGLVAFNSEFIAVSAADACRALNSEAARNGSKGAIEWTPALLQAWETVKAAAANPAVLHTPDPTKDYVVLTDAARTHAHGGAAFLCQWDDKNRRLLLCRAATHTWSSAEENYSAADAELQIFRVACKKWRHYLLANVFQWVTDSESMAKRLQSLHMEGNMRIVNTVLDLQEFRFEAVYAKGAWLNAVDYWSRRRGELATASLPPLKVREGQLRYPIVLAATTASAPSTAVADDNTPEIVTTSDSLWTHIGATTVTPPTPQPPAEAPQAQQAPEQQQAQAQQPAQPPRNRLEITLKDMKMPELGAWQQADNWCGPIHKKTTAAQGKTVQAGDAGDGMRWYAKLQGDVLLVARGRQRQGRTKRQKWQVAVPSAALENIWTWMHTAAAHDRDLTLKSIMRLFARPGLYHASRRLCDACVACQRTSTAAGFGANGSHDKAPQAPTRAGEAIYCDLYTALGRMWLTTLDVYTHFLTVYPIPDKESATVARQLAQHASIFGRPTQLWTDAGTEARGAVEEYCARNGVTHTPALPEVHTGVAALERAHREINRALRKTTTLWEAHHAAGTLPAVEAVQAIVQAINAHPRAPNNLSAFELLFHRRPTLHPAATLHPDLLAELRLDEEPAVRQFGVAGELTRAAIHIAHTLADAQDDRTAEQRAADDEIGRGEQRDAAAAHNEKYAKDALATSPRVGDHVWAHTTKTHQRADKIGGVADEYSGPWTVTAVGLDGNPTRARIRFCLPLNVAGSESWHDVDIDVRRLRPYRLLPPPTPEQGGDTISTLCLREDDWTDEHELVVGERTAAIVLASTPPKFRDMLKRALDAAVKKASANNAAARVAKEEREKKKKKQEEQLREAEKSKEEAIAAAKKYEESKKELNDKRALDQEIVYIQQGPGQSNVIKGRCRDQQTRAKRVNKLSENERKLLAEWQQQQDQRLSAASSGGE